ncbi:hypothetical protein CDD81_1636 [Ophiocordyceps australis]|uniref:Ornithine cyclodeaminase n=1 Tax=Ophiocordyceps australis TaxID=1399860 RepID=A0A2C5Y0Q4_9HYPO|nr:hypothetical protein CDD81_1636 [Ophiocordyceps australis]
MTLTVLSDQQVSAILEGLTLATLDEFRHVLASALHEISTNTGADGRDEYQQPLRISTRHAASKVTTLYMPSCGPQGMGCKVVSLPPTGAIADLSPKASAPTGVINLFSPDGTPIALVHARTLTAFRTALASTCLLNRRANVRTITVFGSGEQAYWHVRLALMMRGSTIRHVNVINRRFSENAAAILQKFTLLPQAVKEHEGWAQARFGLLTPSFHEYDRLLKEQLRGSDVIYCCTPSREPLFPASILTSHEGRKRGRLIVAVGSYTRDMCELPEGVLLQATKTHEHHWHFHRHAKEAGVIIVDSIEGVLKEAGEIISAKINPNHLVELGELVMLHRLAIEESESDSSGNRTPQSADFDQFDGSDKASVTTINGEEISRPCTPLGTAPSGFASSTHSRKSSMQLPFRRKSISPPESEKTDDSLSRWLRDGTVVYKSVGLGLMDLVIGMHLVKLANEAQLGTMVQGF